MNIVHEPIFRHHLERLKSATLQKHTVGMLPEWICKHKDWRIKLLIRRSRIPGEDSS